MVFIYASGDSNNRTSRILIPVWCPKSSKCRNNVAAICILYFLCHIFRIFSRINQAHLITQPLDCSPCHKDRSLQRVIYFSIKPPGNCCNKAILGKHRFLTCIHKQETTGTICIFCFTGLKTGLPKQCGLLISRCTCNRYRTA